MMRLLHYSGQVVERIESRAQDHRSRFDKPKGFWVSVEGENDWKSWCESEEFASESFTYHHEVIFAAGACILHIAGPHTMDAFTAEYARTQRYGGIDWSAVAAKYQGIIIAPYLWSRRISNDCNWYYGWDCASGCIWDASAVASISLITTQEAVVDLALNPVVQVESETGR